MKQRALRGHPSLNLLSEGQTNKRDPNIAPLARADDDEQAALCLEEDATVLFDIDDVSEMLKVRRAEYCILSKLKFFKVNLLLSLSPSFSPFE